MLLMWLRLQFREGKICGFGLGFGFDFVSDSGSDIAKL
jgi:hypothetical protein